MRVKVFDRQGRLVGPVDVGQGRQDRRGVVRAAHAGAIPRRPRQGHRAGLLRHAARQQTPRRLLLRLLRPAAVRVGRQVPLRHRLAQLLPARRRGERHHRRRSRPRHGPHRDPLRPLRRPPRPRLRGRTRARPACATASTPNRSSSPTRATWAASPTRPPSRRRRRR